MITASTSLFAYLWMVLVLEWMTPAIVDIWEGLITLLFFPLLVAVAWGQDKGWAFGSGKTLEKEKIGAVRVEPLKDDDDDKGSVNLGDEGEVRTREEVEDAINRMTEKKQKKNRLQYKKEVMKGMRGGGKGKDQKLKEHILKDVSNCDPKTEAQVEFEKVEDDCVENCDIKNLVILRRGNKDCRIEIRWKVISEDAIEGEHFSLDVKSIVIERGKEEAYIPVNIVDDNDKNPDRHFQIIITEATVLDESPIKVIIGEGKMTRVTVLDDDIPGFFEFSAPNQNVDEVAKCATVEIVRKEGTDGSIRVPQQTSHGTADEGTHQLHIKDEITFKHGEHRQEIKVHMMSDVDQTSNTFFYMHLGQEQEEEAKKAD